MKDVILKVENLSKKFIKKDGSEFWALQDINFELKRGDSFGIIGPNGSGKSTLLKLLSGILKPTSGTITFYGTSASVLDIGTGFHPELTGIENIFLKGELIGKSKKEVNQVVQKIIDFSELGSFINEPVKTYSSGMFVRLAYSTLFFLDFDMYLFDEVLSVGDQSFRSKIKEQQHTFLGNKTYVAVSHDMPEIIESVQTVCLLNQGKIEFIGDKNRAISKYLFGDNEAKMPSDKDPVTLLTTKIDGISISNHTSQKTIKKEDEISFEFELENKCEDELIITCSVLTSSGIRIAADSHRFRQEVSVCKIEEKGRVTIQCTLPKNLFNKGHFLLFFNSNCKDNLTKEWVIAPFFTFELEVQNNTWEENEFFSNFTTPFQPFFDWKITKNPS